MTRHRRSKIRLLLGTAMLALIVTSPVIIWYALPKKPLHVVVIDKTVPTPNYREHNTIFWVLRHLKYVDPSDFRYYDHERDYYGYFPQDSTVSDSSDVGLEHADLLYIADTYGIYRDHRGTIVSDPAPNDTIPLSLVYGGMNAEELRQIVDFSRRGETVIGEFNCLGHPTAPPARETLERIFGLRSGGIIGNYFERLQDVPRWMRRRYFAQHGTEWPYSGSGLVIADEMESNNGLLLVLNNSDLTGAPVLHPDKTHTLMQDVADNVPYFYQFEVTVPDSGSVILATYALRCTPSGREKLKLAGLPDHFPAVISRDGSLRSFYFAGDFADNEVATALTTVWSSELVLQRIYSLYFVSDQTRFFWRFYLPLMKNILAAEYQRHTG
ncbi:MAG: hypothetical protein NTV54_16565 [Ignavibacteriales bacterium]|nr:hypothetical protein [Ignavibacteriales bacterium]